MANIFVNYRKQDSPPYAGRRFDRLVREFPGNCVFMDIDGIAPGEDFVEVIDTKLAGCDAVVALIGHDWSTCTDGNGRRRLDNREDFVRRELTAALKRRIRVIPVLVGGASMPSSDSVPEELVALLRRRPSRKRSGGPASGPWRERGRNSRCCPGAPAGAMSPAMLTCWRTPTRAICACSTPCLRSTWLAQRCGRRGAGHSGPGQPGAPALAVCRQLQLPGELQRQPLAAERRRARRTFA